MKKKHHKRIAKGLDVRHRAEKRFRFYGKMALGIAASLLLMLLVSLLLPGVSGLQHHVVSLDISLMEGRDAKAKSLLRSSLRKQFPAIDGRRQKKELYSLLAPHADKYAKRALSGVPAKSKDVAMNVTVPLSSHVDIWLKNGAPDDMLDDYGLSVNQANWLKQLRHHDMIERQLNWRFFIDSDSRDPEKAGFGGSIIGSLFVVLVCLAVSLPVGVGAAIYLEEFAPKSRWRDVIEVNINNLAAIPSIIFGLLGLFVFLGLFGMPRSSALVGGLTLSLMTLPVIIISTRIALQAVPSSIRDGARALGASPLQVVAHHVLPLALPGIMTGTILGVARAIGETAPLLMIGMVAFIANAPETLNDPATAMPVQIYLWASSPENGFVQKTASGILVLITILLALNLLATYIRTKYETRW